MNNLNHGITDYQMPAYIEEILTHNYCPYFVKMNIVRMNETYSFKYRLGNLTKLNAKELDTYSKLLLLRTIAGICDKTRSYLIRADSYLLEPELIYISGSIINERNIRIMFYPDVRNVDPAIKILLFAERIKKDNIREEREIFDQLRICLESEDMNKAELFLDKTIVRMEGRMMSRAS